VTLSEPEKGREQNREEEEQKKGRQKVEEGPKVR
jgi:hypothetical protein